MVKRDKGGMLFTPQVGLHENVGCIDFESMFPSIISRRNVSYETVNEDGVDTTPPDSWVSSQTPHWSADSSSNT
jgi:DNA polymerase elongation subunit (family B)